MTKPKHMGTISLLETLSHPCPARHKICTLCSGALFGEIETSQAYAHHADLKSLQDSGGQQQQQKQQQSCKMCSTFAEQFNPPDWVLRAPEPDDPDPPEIFFEALRGPEYVDLLGYGIDTRAFRVRHLRDEEHMYSATCYYQVKKLKSVGSAGKLL